MTTTPTAMKTTTLPTRLWLVRHPGGSTDAYRTLRGAIAAAHRADLPMSAVQRDCSAPSAGHSADYAHRVQLAWQRAYRYYRITTDAESCLWRAPSLAVAIRWHYRDTNPGVRDLRSLRRYMAALTPDGAWCRIDRDGEVIVDIGCAP